MRRQDGQARALYRLLTMPLLAALKNCDVIPVDGQLGGQEEAQFCKDLLLLPASSGGMTHSFGRFIRQLLLALFNGFSAWEMVYWVPTTGPNKGKITLRKLDWRPAETLTFLLDGQGEFNGFRQRTFFQGRTIDVKIPKNTAVYYAHEEAERPFYGVSMFESAFYHYDKKTKLYYIAHLAAQRAAVGMRVGTMPPNPAANDKNNFIRGLADLGLAQYMVVPSADWMVQSLKEDSNFDFLGLINHHNSEMSKSILAQWFDQQQGGGQGDSSLVDFGKQSDVTFMMMLDGILEEAAEVCREHPGLRIVLNHTGYPLDRSKEQLAVWKRGMEALASCPNVWCKISGLTVKNQPWTLAVHGAVIRETIGMFGVDRCMFASNHPVDGVKASWDWIFCQFKYVTAGLPWEDRVHLFATNALAFYRIELPRTVMVSA